MRPPTPVKETALRTLLHETAAHVAPSSGGLARIRARTLLPRRTLLRRLWDRITRKNGAPGWTPGTPPHPTADKEPKDMTIIQRHARDLHAGDVITADPDHDRPVRWRITRPPVRTGDGEYALADYTDLDTGVHGIAYFRVLTVLAVEPTGGAA